jgi:competence protein ComEA
MLARTAVFVSTLCLAAGALYLVTQYFTRPRPFEIQVDSPTSRDIAVYVSGAVRNPGVYGLRDGDRVGAALDAAGGPTDDADLSRVNLARRLRDEDQVAVPQRTEVAQVHDVYTAASSQSLVDLNRASIAELDALPGIGSVYAQRIIDSRQKEGPFRSVDELLDRKIMPRATFDRIKDLVTTRP